MTSYDMYGDRRTSIWEPDAVREAREQREYEAEQLRELNERIGRADRELRQMRRLADGIDDGSPDDDGAGYDEQKDTHGVANTLGHVHGKYAKHQHFHDNDHSDAPINPGGAVAGKVSPAPSSLNSLSEPQRRARQASSSDDLLQAATVRELREKGLDPAKVQADLRSTDRVTSAKAGQLIEQAQRAAVQKINYVGSRQHMMSLGESASFDTGPATTPVRQTRQMQQRQAERKMIEDGRWNGTIMGFGDPPVVSDYNRAPGSHVDEGDVAADESDEVEASPLGGTDQASGFDLEKNTHGPMTGLHKHGKFAEHVHARDNNHGQALLKAAGALGQNY